MVQIYVRIETKLGPGLVSHPNMFLLTFLPISKPINFIYGLRNSLFYSTVCSTPWSMKTTRRHGVVKHSCECLSAPAKLVKSGGLLLASE
jgi:hypothetical protein